MQKLKWVLPLLLLLGVIFTACEDNDPFVSGPRVDVTFAGRVVDENNEPVLGALIKAGDESAVTDQNGVFRLASTRLPEDHAVLSVEKAGYFAFSRAYQVKDKSIQSLSIRLLPHVEAGSVSSGSGGTIQVSGGATLIFPANAFALANGSAFNGNVRVMARFLDPTDRSTLSLSMPGNLSAINAAGELRQLSTFGMIGVELYSANGQKLQVAAGQLVEVRIPIDPSIVATAPDEIPLWHYNEADGYWLEDGLAKKVGNEYVGSVSHFSWWNYDATYPSVNVSGNVYFNNLQTPAVGVQVWIGPANQGLGWGCGHGETDNNGFYAGAIPKDMLLTITVLQWTSGCPNGGQLYTANIGPFSADVTLPDIIINTPTQQTVQLDGRLVDCNNAPVANGYVNVSIPGYVSTPVYTNANGEFSFTQAYCNSNAITGSVVGYDITALNESVVQNFTINNGFLDLGDIAVCTNLTEYVEYTLDGGSNTIMPDPSGSIFPDTLPISFYNTQIFASLPNVKSINLGFQSSTISTGIFPITQFFVENLEVDIQQSNLSTAVTSAALNQGDMIIGTFGGTFMDFNGGSHNITGSYRVKRDW